MSELIVKANNPKLSSEFVVKANNPKLSSSYNPYGNLIDVIKFDTLETDVSNLGKTVSNIYGNWQSEQTMKKTKPQIEAMYNRLTTLQKYNKQTGNTQGEKELSDTITAYKGILDTWDDITDEYGKYKDGNAYNKAKKAAEKSAKEIEKMKSADLNFLQSEIDNLNSQLENKKASNKVNSVKTANFDSKGVAYNRNIKSTPEIEALEKEISEKKIFLNRAKWLQKGMLLANVSNPNSKNYDKDFEKYADKGSKIPYDKVGSIEQKNAGGGRTYPAADDVRAAALAMKKHYSGGKLTAKERKDTLHNNYLAFTHMTDSEFKTFSYYLAKDTESDGNQAANYLNTILEDLNGRKAVESFKKYEDNKFLELLYGVNAGINQFSTGIDNLTNSKDEYIPVNSTQQLSGMIREDLKQDGAGWGVAYDLVTNVSNMAPSILASAVSEAVLPGSGAAVGATLMGVSAAGNAYQEKINSGWDKSDARVYSTIVGVSEAGLSYALGGVSKLGGKLSGNVITSIANGVDNAAAKFAINYGGKLLSEGIEESLQEFLEPFFENIALGYAKNNLSDVNWGEVAYSGALAVLSTGLLEFRGSVIETSREVKTAKIFNSMPESFNNLVIQKGLDFDTGSKAYKLAENYKTAKDNGDKVSGTQMSNLFDEIITETKNDQKALGEWVSIYESLEMEGYSFPKKVDALFETVKNSVSTDTTDNLSDDTVGDFVMGIIAYSPGVSFSGEVAKTVDGGSETDYNGVETSVDENTSSAMAEDNTEQGADGGLINEIRERTGFTEPSDREIYQPPTKQEELDALLGTPKNAKQRHIEKVSDKFGIKIIWSDEVSRGKYIPSTKSIVLNPNIRTAEMYNFVFKHEFTHYLEGKQGYTDFKNYVFKKSALFEKWVRERLEKNGIDSTGSREKIIKRLTQIQYEAYKNSDEMSKVMRDRFTMNDAEEEVLADFVGERLLGTGGQLEETLDMLSDLNRKHRGIFQKIRDFVRDMINRFKGDKTFKGLVSDLEYLNERLKRVAESDNKKISDNETEKYSIAGERAVTADKSLLETAKQRIENGEESETVRRETGWFKGYDGKWRFEINDKMSELVENPKLETHGNDEDGLYQTARLADVLKHDDLFKAYPELKDYKVIIQETNTGVEGSFFPKRKEIVLSRNLFERITKEYYDYLNGGRKAEIAKIEQTPEYKEYSKFYDNPELANIDPEEWLKLEEEARDKFFSSELGKRYYQLNWGKVNIRKYEPGWSKGAKAVLFHEIQHAIQKIEGFASGSNQRYWNEKIQRGLEVRKNDKRIQNAEKEYRKIFDSIPKDFKEKIREMNRATIAQDYDTVMRIQDELYESEYADLFSQLDMADFVRRSDRGEVLTADDLYENTAGEIESRDVEKRLNYSAEQRKNTRPDIDRTDVVFADGSVSSFLSKGNKSDSKRLIQLIQENINEIPKNNLYDISGDGIIDGVKSRYILDIFDMQGNTAYRKDLGTIELTESGAESTIFHGFGKNKLIAAKGIKNVIENGKIISKIENYQNKGNTRYVIAGYGTINNLDSIMAVAINEYVAENGRKSFYLHEIVIKNKDASPFMAEQQKTVSAGKASFDITVPQKVQSVNTSISENSENDTGKNSIAILSADELLDKYDRGEITREEYLKQTDTITRRAALRYVQKWERENGIILNSQKRLEAEREKAVELEREEQQMRKDRESNIWAIRRTVRKLDRALRTNTNSKHIPEAYKNVVRGVCELFVENDKATFEHKDLADIYAYYSSMKGNGETIPDAPQYDPFIDELLKSLISTLSGKKLTELNNLELNYIRMVTDALNYTVDHEAQVFIDGKKVKYEEVGRAALNDIENANPNKLIGALENQLATELREYLYEDNLLPEYFLKRLGPTFEKIFNDLIDGMNKWARNMETSKDFWSNTKNKYDYDGWKNDTVSFKTELGHDITITIEQAMQLVATAQRERSNNVQKPNHLSIGGVVIDFNYIKKAIKSHRKRKISKSDLTTIWNNVNGKAIQISFNDVEVVSKMLSSNQKGYIKDVVDFLSTQCAAWGNEVTMEQYGYRQFNESNYFPYVSSKLFLETDPARNDNTIIRRASFTHALQKNADNPLLLTSFTDVAAQHIESMCNFNAMTMPLETLNKVLNYQTESIKGVKTGQSVKQAIENKFGTGAAECMQNLIKDLNTGIRGDQRDRFLNKMISLYKKNAVLANVSVVIQQPFAIIRAIADINVKYFAKASKYHSKNNYEECKQYAPVAIIKQMGRFDTGVGVNNTAWMTGEKTIRDKADDFFGWGAGKADEVAWSFLWSSVKAEIADTTDLKVGSEEFLTKAGERFTELVNKTQVYDSVLTKSQNMRNKGLMGAVTSFMAEPTVSFNMLLNSFLDFTEGKISGKKFARVITSVVTAEIVTSIAKSLVYAAREDDEDKSYLEKYLKNVVANSLSDMNLAGKIPYIRDIITLWEGYNIDRPDAELLADLVKAVKMLSNENKSWDEKARRISESLAAFYGVPLKNVLRDIEATVKTVKGFILGENKTDIAGLEFAISEGLGIIKNTSDKYSALAKAGENGNEEKYDRMYDNLLEAGKDEGDIKSGIKNYYRTDKDVKKEGSKLFSDLEDNKTFKSLKKEDKSQLEKDIISSLATEKTVSAMVREPDVFDELYEALRNNKNLYNQKKKELMASGMSESLIDDGIEAARISYMKSIGIDVNEYLLYKIATSKKYADTNNSGGVSKSEKTAAINKMDLDENAKRFFNGSYK